MRSYSKKLYELRYRSERGRRRQLGLVDAYRRMLILSLERDVRRKVVGAHLNHPLLFKDAVGAFWTVS